MRMHNSDCNDCIEWVLMDINLTQYVIVITHCIQRDELLKKNSIGDDATRITT